MAKRMAFRYGKNLSQEWVKQLVEMALGTNVKVLFPTGKGFWNVVVIVFTEIDSDEDLLDMLLDIADIEIRDLERLFGNTNEDDDNRI